MSNQVAFLSSIALLDPEDKIELLSILNILSNKPNSIHTPDGEKINEHIHDT